MSILEGYQVTDPPEAFHAGERAIQERFDVRERLAKAGSRVIMSALSENFRGFLGSLSYLVVGTTDRAGRPWATMLFGSPGFLGSPRPDVIRIAIQAEVASPGGGLVAGDAIAMIGIDLASRNRIRVNGEIAAVEDGAITVVVRQAFGNCPQYIWPRVPALPGAAPTPGLPVSLTDAEVRRIVEQADTFFIASRFARDGQSQSADMDVSHRGGGRGFLSIDGGELVWPEYRGNFYFNTLGNLLIDPACGLYVPDFKNGRMLSMTGRARIVWDAATVKAGSSGVPTNAIVRFAPTALLCGASPVPCWDLVGTARYNGGQLQ